MGETSPKKPGWTAIDHKANKHCGIFPDQPWPSDISVLGIRFSQNFRDQRDMHEGEISYVTWQEWYDLLSGSVQQRPLFPNGQTDVPYQSQDQLLNFHKNICWHFDGAALNLFTTWESCHLSNTDSANPWTRFTQQCSAVFSVSLALLLKTFLP